MTKFINGFANGTVLGLASSPRYLRVTKNRAGKIDALDQPTDAPHADEEISVYVLVSDDGGAFVDGRDKKTGKRFGGFQKIASYKLNDIQPHDMIARDNGAFTQWCNEQIGAGDMEHAPRF